MRWRELGRERLSQAVPLLFVAFFATACEQSPLREYVGMNDSIVDAEFASTLKSVVLVGRSLWIAKVTGEITEVELPWDGCAVSVYEEHAAVSHDGFFSLVDLRTGVVTGTKEVNLRCPEILLGADYIYLLSNGRDRGVSFFAPRSSLELAPAFSSGVEGRAEIHESRRRIYGVEPRGGDTLRYNLNADGMPKDRFSHDSIYHYEYPICPDIWLSADGDRLFNACGAVFTTRGKMLRTGRHHENPSPEYDQIYLDRLPLRNRIRSLCDNNRVLVTIPDDGTIQETSLTNRHFPEDQPLYSVASPQVLIFGSQDYQLISEVDLPSFSEEVEVGAVTRAEYAFCIDSERAAVVVSDGKSRWGVVAIRFVNQG